MILADKIIRLRKKQGWSQEELADKIDVSRQAVSKWESAAAVPALEKILQLAELFGVTSDYLLKDEIEDGEAVGDTKARDIKRVSLEEAERYIALRKRAALKIAVATFLCILSPVTLMILSVAAETPYLNVSEALAGAVGIAVLIAFVLCAVPIYIYCGFKNAPYEFLEKSEPFELDRGAEEFVKAKLAAFGKAYMAGNIVATCLCIISPVPLLLAAFTENELLITAMLSVTIVIAGIGASIFIVVGVRNASMQKLLKEGDYTLQGKRRSAVKEPVGFAYWGISVAAYFLWSFLSGDWHITWLIFAVGGVLFPVLMAVCNVLVDRHFKGK